VYTYGTKYPGIFFCILQCTQSPVGIVKGLWWKYAQKRDF